MSWQERLRANGGPIIKEGYDKIKIPKFVAVFAVALAVAVFGQVIFRGFAAAIAILIAIIAGYIVAISMNISGIFTGGDGKIVCGSEFHGSKFSIEAVLIIIPASLVVISGAHRAIRL